jgi:hypothetical protein
MGQTATPTPSTTVRASPLLWPAPTRNSPSLPAAPSTPEVRAFVHDCFPRLCANPLKEALDLTGSSSTLPAGRLVPSPTLVLAATPSWLAGNWPTSTAWIWGLIAHPTVRHGRGTHEKKLRRTGVTKPSMMTAFTQPCTCLFDHLTCDVVKMWMQHPFHVSDQAHVKKASYAKGTCNYYR